MDAKSKEIYEKIESFLEERKGRDRRANNGANTIVKDGVIIERRKQDRRSSNNQ